MPDTAAAIRLDGQFDVGVLDTCIRPCCRAPYIRWTRGETRDVRIRALLARLVPDRLRDRLIARALRLPG